eukprot:490679_1
MAQPFKAHMSFEDAQKLKTGDKIDFRVPNYLSYISGVIINKDESKGTIKVKRQYTGSNKIEYQTTISYVENFKFIAEHGSILKRPAHRLKDITTGSFVDVNVPLHTLWKKNIIKGWIKGKVTRRYYSQIEVFVETNKGNMGTVHVHLDNTDEVDRFGLHTKEKCSNHIPILLETKRAYINTPDAIKKKCTKAIIDNVYGGMDNVLCYLINNATTTHLTRIQNIIKQKNIQHNDKAKQSEQQLSDQENKSQNVSENTQDTPKISSLSELSSDSITNICSYLDRDDIKSFKLTSFSNGMICLREMEKFNVSAFNTNELINDEHQKYVDTLGFTNICRSNFTYQRFPSNTKYCALQNIFEEKYNIPPCQQAALAGKDGRLLVLDTKIHPYGKYKLKLMPIKTEFILFDKRNVIQLDSINDKPMITDIFDTKKQRLIILKWFDVYFQEIISLQFVIGNNDMMTVARLTKYVENEFIATTKQQKIWHSKLITYFKKMNKIAPRHEKLIAFKAYPSTILRANNPIEKLKFAQMLIFQLNPTHPIFAKKKLVTIQEKYNLLTQ